MNDKLEEIRARHAAATPGPWRWYGYVKGRGIGGSKAAKRRCVNLHLATVDRGRIYVMQFERSGFDGAQPRFQRYRKPEDAQTPYGGGVMVGAGEMAGGPGGYLKEYSGEFVSIDNQDAVAIERSWEDIDFLIDQIDRKNMFICSLLHCSRREEFEQGNHDDACPLRPEGFAPSWKRAEQPA